MYTIKMLSPPRTTYNVIFENALIVKLAKNNVFICLVGDLTVIHCNLSLVVIKMASHKRTGIPSNLMLLNER